MFQRIRAIGLVCLLAVLTWQAKATPIGQSRLPGGSVTVAVGSLPVCNTARQGWEYWVTGLAATSSCTGTGSAKAHCYCDGASWLTRPSGGGTSVSVDGASVSSPNFDDGGSINFGATGSTVTGTVKSGAITAAMLTGSFSAFTCSAGVCTIPSAYILGSMVANATISDAQMAAMAYGKLTGVPTARLLGRTTAGTGVAEPVALDTSLEFSGGSLRRAALTGDVTAAAGSNATAIAPGAIVDADVNASAAIAATKSAYAGSAGLTAGSVEAALDELDTETPKTSDLLLNTQVFRTDADSAASDGTLSDWSAVNQSDASEGLKLPQHASNCPNATGAGMVCYDTTEKIPYIGDGTRARPAGGAPGSSGVMAAYVPSGGLYQQLCSSTLGCPDAAGALVFNLWPYWTLANPGQRSDVNASMWTAGSPYTADAATDFIVDFSTAAVTGSGTQYAQTFTVGADDVADKFFCRCNASPYAVASADSCGAGTPTALPTSSEVESVVLKDASTGRYALIGVSGYNGCNSANHTVTVAGRIPFAVASGDSMQLAWPDGVHADGYYYSWVAQNLIEARWETMFVPRQNMLANGDFEAGTTGWNTVTAGTAPLGNDSSFDPTSQQTNHQMIKQSLYQLSTGRVAGDSIRSNAVTVTPGRSYTIRVWAQFTSGNNAHHVQVRPLNGGDNSALTDGTEYKSWIFDGYQEIALTAGESPYECYVSCYFVLKVKTASATSIKLDIAGLTGTATLYADEAVMFPSLHNDLELHYVFPDIGNQSWYLHTDSRGVDANGQIARLPGSFDTMKAALRTNWTMARSLARSSTSTPGTDLGTVISGGFPGFTAYRPQFGLIHLGVNSPTTYTKANVVSAINLTKQAGAIPVYMLEGPYRGDISGNDPANTCGATTNCATYMNSVAEAILHGGVAN